MIPTTLNASGVTRAAHEAGLISAEQLTLLAQEVSQQGRRPVEAIIHLNLCKPDALAKATSLMFGVPLIDLNAIDPTQLALESLDAKLIQTYQVIPLYKRGQTLFIGTADPTELQTFQQLKFNTQLNIEPIVVEYDKLKEKIQQTCNVSGSALDQEFAKAELQAIENDLKYSSELADVDDAPVVRYVQKMLLDAIAQSASDLHFEPYETFYRVRFRVDGVLREIAQPPVSTREKIAARIKILSNLDIAERRVPQDGRMRLVLDDKRFIDFRVSTLPTIFGEKIVIRVLDPSSAKVGIEFLGYEPDQKEALLNATSQPDGMILVTGPTGSGKTVSLYTCLNLLNKPGVNISTAEDPAEINLPGINQVNVNEKVGLTFSAALRAFLRQDPDVVMVGEIRDLETADIAMKASQTGHLVFSTLHTNDAAATIIRLINMGVAPFNIASSIRLITAQRLIRRLCACKETDDIPPEALVKAGFAPEEITQEWQPFKAVGCPKCNGSGYKGRAGIYEVMPITPQIQRLILNGANELDIRRQARQDGVYGMREAGLKKIKAGITTLEEVLSATPE